MVPVKAQNLSAISGVKSRIFMRQIQFTSSRRGEGGALKTQARQQFVNFALISHHVGAALRVNHGAVELGASGQNSLHLIGRRHRQQQIQQRLFQFVRELTTLATTWPVRS